MKKGLLLEERKRREEKEPGREAKEEWEEKKLVRVGAKSGLARAFGWVTIFGGGLCAFCGEGEGGGNREGERAREGREWAMQGSRYPPSTFWPPPESEGASDVGTTAENACKRLDVAGQKNGKRTDLVLMTREGTRETTGDR